MSKLGARHTKARTLRVGKVVHELVETIAQLRTAGEQLASFAFTLAECDHLTRAERRRLRHAAKQWDKVVFDIDVNSYEKGRT